MYEIKITDATGTVTLPPLEVPLTVGEVIKGSDIDTLSNDIYTDYFPVKRLFTHTWAWLSEDDFNILKGYYDRQMRVYYKYPTITIEELNVYDLVCKMSLSPRNIIDQCGTVQGVEVSFRESKQQPTGSSS